MVQGRMEIMTISEYNKTRSSALYQQNCCGGKYHPYQNIHVHWVVKFRSLGNSKLVQSETSLDTEYELSIL